MSEKKPIPKPKPPISITVKHSKPNTHPNKGVKITKTITRKK